MAMPYALNGSTVLDHIPNQLQTKVIFDTVSEKKKPESVNPGSHKINSLDSPHESVRMELLNNSILADVPNLYKHNGTSVENSRFIKFIPSQASDWLQENHPNAFLLLCLIAKRARRFNGHIDGLEIGMAQIGDYRLAGIDSERKYRTAKEVLVRIGAIKIVETARKRKKSTTDKTTRTTTTGTLVTLLKSDIWDINPEYGDDRKDELNDDRPTTDRRPTDDEQEHKESKEVKEVSSTMSNSQAHSTKSEKIFFNWEKKKLEGIEQSDIVEWQKAFPNVNVIDYLKFIEQDIGIKQTKYGRRKQIVRTVVIYLRNQNENQAAYKARNQNQGKYQKPQPKYNHDTSPRNPKNSISFAEEV